MKEAAAAMPVPITVHCFDTDTVNHTFGRYESLDVDTVAIFDATHNINARVFDRLVEKIINSDGIAIVDNGATTYVPLMAYITENRVPDLFAEADVRFVIHVLVVSGQDLSDCLAGLNQALTYKNAEVVVWLNERYGKVEQKGKDFCKFKIYEDNRNRIIGVVRTGIRNADTYGEDIKQMTSQNMTFAEVDTSTDWGFMPKQRMRTLKRELWEQLAALPIAVNEQAGSHESEK